MSITLICIQFLRTNWICYKSYPELLLSLLLLNLIILSQCLTEAQLEVD